MQRSICFLWILVIFLCPLIAWAQSVEQLYQDGQHKEQILGDLQAAISSYQKVLERASQNRQIAAQALFRIGRCYEKLGNMDESLEAYRRLIQDFDDRTEVVAEARARLAALGHPVSPSMVVRQVWVPADDTLGMPSPDGRYLTYADWSSMGNLAVRDLTTGKSRLLTDEATWDGPDQYAYYSIWSPDGKQIAYAWFNRDVWELRLVGFDGSEPRVLCRNEELEYLQPHEWSPDGKYILTWLYKESIPSEIGFISVADGSVRVLKSRMAFGGNSANMSISPDGRHIVYDLIPGEGSHQRDIFLLTVDGGREVPLIQYSANDYGPVWTPDGSRIVFVSDRTGDVALWLLDVVDGKPQGEPQLIQQNMNRILPMGFTNDGSFYYNFANYAEQKLGDVCIATIDPATGKVLAPPEKIPQRFEGMNALPDWSPDGKYLAYMSLRGVAFAESVTAHVLVIRSVETGEERELPQGHIYSILRWSPDGRHILIGRPKWYDRIKDALSMINVETGDVTSVVRRKLGTSINAAAWSHDGKQIFHNNRVHTGRTEYSWSIVAHNPETGEDKELYGEEEYAPIALAVSPDGQQLAFHNRQTLQVMPTTGGEPREILRLQPPEIMSIGTTPAWTPDGRYIIVGKGEYYPDDPEATARELFDVWRFPVEGGEPQKLGFAMSAFHQLSVHPDGRRIAFTQPGARWEREIWAMENFLPELKGAK